MTPTGRARYGMVRPYTPTAGRAWSSRTTLDEATLLILTDNPAGRAALTAPQQRVIELCVPGVLSVAEVAAYLQLPGAVTKVLAADLVDAGHLIARAPVPAAAQQHDTNLLERILDGLKAL